MILAAGRLEEKKGLRYLVEACGMLRERGVDIRCSIAGDGPARGELCSAISLNHLQDVVTLTGELTQDEMMDLYGRTSVFVLPSIVGASGDRDGLANVILEAMAMKIPVISTTASAASEAIGDGVSGFIIPSGDSGALADRLEELSRDSELRARMGEEGRSIVIERFDITVNVARLAALFEASIEKADHGTS